MIVEWMKFASALKLLTQGPKLVHYPLLGLSNKMICKLAFTRILGLTRPTWIRLEAHIKANTFPVHGLKGKPGNNQMSLETKELLHVFFNSLEQLGNPRATRLIRHKTGRTELRDTDDELVELPSCHSKRSLYARYLQDSGWSVKLDAKSRVIEMNSIDESVESTVIAWSTFLQFWSINYKHVVLQSPAKDVCGECFEMAYLFRSCRTCAPIYDRSQEDDDSEENDSDSENSRRRDSGNDSESDDSTSAECNDERVSLVNEQSTDDTEMLQREAAIEAASKHVKMAQEQRAYFQAKKEQAKFRANSPPNERICTFVVDYAQNMYLPSFNAEQPGETYYYSPLNLYCLGIVDCSETAETLSAHIYYEGEGKKVVIMLLA